MFSQVFCGVFDTVGVDGVYDWIGLWSYKNLAPADGTKMVYGDFVPVLRARFDPDEALAVGGCFDWLAKALTTSLATDEA
eukprot:scaffold41425_cov35-Phaeocystis_antarctica.AAC.1